MGLKASSPQCACMSCRCVHDSTSVLNIFQPTILSLGQELYHSVPCAINGYPFFHQDRLLDCMSSVKVNFGNFTISGEDIESKYWSLGFRGL